MESNGEDDDLQRSLIEVKKEYIRYERQFIGYVLLFTGRLQLFYVERLETDRTATVNNDGGTVYKACCFGA